MFSACHRLHIPLLSEEENRQLFGKCNNPNGHGHNYKVEVTVRGGVDPINGMVMNLVTLKNCINRCIIDVLDHKNIDKDVSYFSNVVSTAENIAVFIWKQLEQEISKELLYEVKVHETEKNVVYFRGEML